MKILVVGGGGREHALCWKLAASPLVTKLYCAPGNAGIAAEAECVPIGQTDIDQLVAFARDQKIDFVVVGPEQPLVLGLVDALDAAGISSFGPNKAAAVLEGSKGFVKDLCARENIPTAAYQRFTDSAAALAYVRQQGAPIVIKADGLAAGKGVTVAATLAEAEAAVRAALDDDRFGEAGAEVVVEECLVGEEVSFFVLVDGAHTLPLASAQDHKRAHDGDTGPNTGGMGAYSPAPILTPALEHDVMTRIIAPTVRAMATAGTPFKGVLYAGLMLTAQGPKLIEYNVRFGDPECQVMMLRLKSDLLPALLAVRDGALKNFDLRWHDDPALTVVMAARGYPDSYQKGSTIGGLAEAGAVEGVTVFHAGTKRRGDAVVADGGRVLNVTAIGRDVAQARTRAYDAIARLDWPEGFCRTDIAWRALARRS
ncbi:MAG: phosphoribosylamine--glycine ligase [Alphaproteobacteria bacterium]|nr:phosphoribosylamine--glycine ligase [Alphaproteobacteria bacterium]